MWCLERDILLTAQHLPGKENVIADTESRLDAESVNISTVNVSVLLPRGQSFCNKTDLPTASFLQLEARSPSRRDGCLPPGLDASETLCQPPMEPDRDGLDVSGGARSGCRPNSASVAITALVPQTSGTTGIIPPKN